MHCAQVARARSLNRDRGRFHGCIGHWRPARRQPPVWRATSSRRIVSRAQIRAVHHERNRSIARTKRRRLSYGAGEWGRNRVRVFPDPKTGIFQIEWRDNGRRLTRSLKHRDWSRAKKQADEFAAGFATHRLNAEAASGPLTLETLFDIYGEEVTPGKSLSSRQHDRAATKMFLGFLGNSRDPATLSQRDWDRFIKARRAGSVGPSGRPVSDRMVERDLRFLISVFNWASKSRDERGHLLLESNPLRGLKTPTEKNPTRVILSEDEYRALLSVSREVDWRFPRRACARARDRPPHRSHPQAPVVRYRHGGRDHPVAQRAREDRIRARYTHHPRGGRRVGRSAAEQPRDRWRSTAALVEGSLDERGGMDVPRLVEQGRTACRPGAEARAAAGTRCGASLPRTSWTSPSRCSANSEAGRRPRPSCSATSGPTRGSSERRSRAVAGCAPDPQLAGPFGGNHAPRDCGQCCCSGPGCVALTTLKSSCSEPPVFESVLSPGWRLGR